MLHVCLASVLGLALPAPATEQPEDVLSPKASAIEAKVVALTQRNDAMTAGRIAAQAMRGAELSRSDRYHLGSLAFEAYIVAHLNAPSSEALCQARRVGRAMKQLAATPGQKAAARELIGQADVELGKLRPPGQCVQAQASVSEEPPPLMAVARAPAQREATVAGDPGAAPTLESPGAGRVGEVPTVSRDDASASQGSVQPASRPARPLGPRGTKATSPRAWAGLGTMVLGVGLLAGMGASLRGRQLANRAIVDLDRLVEMENRDPTVDESWSVQQANLRWHRLGTAAVITGSVGVVALLTGTVLLATGLRRRPVEVTPWGASTSAGLLISGSF